MWFLRFKVRPDPRDERVARYGGANVVCWVDTSDEGEALTVADAMLRRDGWRMNLAVDESTSITRETQTDKGMAKFEQAARDGFAYVAFTWPR